MDKGDENQHSTSASEVEEVMIDQERPEKTIKIGAGLPTQLRDEIIHVLTTYKIIFAWGLKDMPGVDQSVICHHLLVIPGSKPVRPKKRHLSSERREFVKEETRTLLVVSCGAHNRS